MFRCRAVCCTCYWLPRRSSAVTSHNGRLKASCPPRAMEQQLNLDRLAGAERCPNGLAPAVPAARRVREAAQSARGNLQRRRRLPARLPPPLRAAAKAGHCLSCASDASTFARAPCRPPRAGEIASGSRSPAGSGSGTPALSSGCSQPRCCCSCDGAAAWAAPLPVVLALLEHDRWQAGASLWICEDSWVLLLNRGLTGALQTSLAPGRRWAASSWRPVAASGSSGLQSIAGRLEGPQLGNTCE